MDIIDLHCDLLAYLEERPGRSPHDPIARCSYPQLKAGRVKLQVMALFTETTPSSVKQGMAQVELLHKLTKEDPLSFAVYGAEGAASSAEQVLPAFENAS